MISSHGTVRAGIPESGIESALLKFPACVCRPFTTGLNQARSAGSFSMPMATSGYSLASTASNWGTVRCSFPASAGIA